MPSHYHPITEQDKAAILEAIQVDSFESLVKNIPAALKNHEVRVGSGLSELEVQNLIRSLAGENKTTSECLSFLGGGAYEHFIPAAVAQMIGRQEFYTAYTPYQAEASQGTLQAIYEYQSLMTELTGLDVTNASHYDGATSTAEAALLAVRHTGRSKILVSRAVHPHYRETLATYLEGTPYDVMEFGFEADKGFDRKDLDNKLTGQIAGVIFQSPNFFGILEDLEGISERLHEQGILMILAANPLSYAIFKSAGEWGADLAVGDGQPFGIPLQYGGPYLGYFSTTRALMRQIPGRLCGLTQDADGKRAFCLTLQAREQHIRRERAASNICSNQALCALAACVHLTLLGRQGIRELAELNRDRAYYLRQNIGSLNGYSIDAETPIFNEFVVCSEKPFKQLNRVLNRQNIFPGVDLSRFYPELKNEFLVCATETKTREQLDRFCEALKAC